MKFSHNLWNKKINSFIKAMKKVLQTINNIKKHINVLNFKAYCSSQIVLDNKSHLLSIITYFCYQ